MRVWKGRRLASIWAIARETAAVLENAPGPNLNSTNVVATEAAQQAST